MIEINDKNIYFPIRYIPKNHQLESLEFLKKSILTGKKNLLLNLGTGLGKSFISVALFSNWYRNYVNKDAKFDIITNSKILQQQYLRDFDFIDNYKGKSNYYCQKFDCQCDTGKEMCRILKSPCDSCPYDKAKNKFIDGDIGLTNYHLFNTLSFYQKDTLRRRNANVLIVDECHLFESVFSDFMSSKVSAKILKKCGIELKEIETLDNRFISKIKTLDKYLEFLERKLIPILEVKLNIFENDIKNSSSKKKMEISNFIQNIEGKLSSFKQLFESYRNDPNNIVLDIDINKNDKFFSGTELVSQHIWVHDFLNDYIWKYYDHILFTSATILSKDVFSSINGLDPKLTSYFEIDTPFKKENRMIYYIKIGKMNMNTKEETFQKQIPWINKILEKYKNKKGIIHCTTYEIAEWVKENIKNSRLLFHDNENRDEILEKHINSTDQTVLVSPSMSSGVDLFGDRAEFSIILKIPYLNLGSKKIVARKQTNKDYYSNATISELIQMCGRTVRSENEKSDTFILDSNFSDLLKYNYHTLPKYFTDAIKQLKI
jgi:Rad3-related DNA helicase